MRRKDYELIAREVGDAYRITAPTGPKPAAYVEGFHAGTRFTALHLARALAADNPRFDRAQFLTNAGIPDIKTEDA